jgi:cobalt/nickel transport system permease protein
MIRPADLRLRLATALGALFLLTLVEGALPAALALLAVLGLFVVARQPLPWRRLLHLEAFLILLFVTLPFTLPGEPVFSIGPFTATDAGLWRTVTLACKVTASVMLLALLFGAVDPIAIGSALRGLRAPETLVRLFVTTVRYIALIRDEFHRLRDAMRARAFRPRSTWHTWRSYGYLIGMLVVRALDRAERVEEAMRLRGYSGRFPRLDLPGPAAVDWAASGAILGGAGLLLLMDLL